MPDESIRPPVTYDNDIAPSLDYINARARVKLDGRCLKQDKATYTHKKIVNIYIVNEIYLWPYKRSFHFTLKNYLLGAVKLAKRLILIRLNILSMVWHLLIHMEVFDCQMVVDLVET